MALSEAYGQSDITLDKLSDCSGLAAIREKLDYPISISCRPPLGDMERRMMSQFNGPSDLHACLLRTNPIPKLAGFTCVDQAYKGTRELSCFRAVDKAILGDYVRRYESVYSRRVSQYLDAAAHCQVGNGDATAIKNSLFPETLKAIASAEFGFVLGLGKGSVTTSRAYHAYAQTDPDLHGTSGAVEVFDVVNIPGGKLPDQEPAMADRAPTLAVTVSNLDGAAAAETLRNMYRLPVSVDARAFDFQYNGGKNVPFETKKDDLDGWQQGMADVFINAGYAEVPESEFEKMGLTSDEVRDRLVQSLKFGQRKFVDQYLGPKLFMLFRDAPGDCGDVVDLFVAEPENNVKADYGTILMMAITFGHCCENSRRGRLINEVVDYIRSEVKDR
jgi:hypothetical protein